MVKYYKVIKFSDLKIGEKFDFEYREWKKTSNISAKDEYGNIRYFRNELRIRKEI